MFNNENASTINFTMATDNYQKENSVIDFKAVIAAYRDENGLKHDFNEIFSQVSAFLYWSAVRAAQIAGVTSSSISFIQQNRNSWLERPEYVENRIQSSLSKVIRRCCSLNMRIGQYGMQRFLTVKFSRDENSYYSLKDAKRLAMDIASAYEQHLGVSILETNWCAEQSKAVL